MVSTLRGSPKKIGIPKNIISFLQEGPNSINEIASKLKLNWKTTEENLTLLKELNRVSEEPIKNKRMFFLKDPNNYFKLPIKTEHKKIISTIYFHIKRYCKELYQKEPTKTQVYKIMWKLNIKDLPIGWYRYGPICIQPYNGNEEDYQGLTIDKGLIKETVADYCSKDNIELQNQVYQEANNQLYLTKTKLLTEELEKEELNLTLMDLMKYASKEDVVDYFARAVMMQGFTNQLKEYFFEQLWPLITKINLKQDLKFYYQDNIKYYFDEDIQKTKEEAELKITEIISNHLDIKYSQDKRYQSWKKKRQSD